MSDKLPSQNCGAMILPMTASETEGLCQPCTEQGYHRHKKIKAADFGDVQKVEQLVSKGVDVKVRDPSDGKTAMPGISKLRR